MVILFRNNGNQHVGINGFGRAVQLGSGKLTRGKIGQEDRQGGDNG